jgi:hypothetical protein
MKKILLVIGVALLLSGCIPIMEGMETWFYEDVVGMPLNKTDGTEDDLTTVEIEIVWPD